MNLEKVKEGTALLLENGYKAKILSIDKDSSQRFKYNGEVYARSGIIDESWDDLGSAMLFAGFTIQEIEKL